MTGIKLVDLNKVNVARLSELVARPSLFERGEPLFWNDPHISKKMLEAHLNPDWEAASRPHQVIQQTVNWLHGRLQLPPVAQVIDLGCGPGLYASRMSKLGWRVTGMDYSERSIAYAKEQAALAGQEIEYIYQDYLTLDHQGRYDAAFLIYYDIGVFADEPRDLLLANVHRALKPGAYFVFDVMTKNCGKTAGRNWTVGRTGFWRPGPHLVFSETFEFPEAMAWVDQYVVIDEQGEATTYRNWDRCYSPETVRAALEQAGFTVEDYYQDLTGTPFTPDSPTMAVVARRA